MAATAERKVQINKRSKVLPRAELEKLDKTALVDKIEQLEAHIYQLKNLLRKKLDTSNKSVDKELTQELHKLDTNDCRAQEAKGHRAGQQCKKRRFDFKNTNTRHVLLKLLYFGWDYHGFACQEDSNDTIEHYLFKALTQTCLIQSRETSNYHRCGRTDKEVSAFCQVVSIDLRSKFTEDSQLTVDALDSELDYCTMLNGVLPKNIQCIAWMPLRSKLYSARFDCCGRAYRYYFPKGNLNIEAMSVACQLLERSADFRNFCKMDVHNGVTNYVRHLQSATIHRCPNEVDDGKGYTMYYLEIKANAFLWHQIRCIMSVLLLIGQEKEEPCIIDDLLDVAANPCKPQYTPAAGLPLNLFNCEFRPHAEKTACYEALGDAENAIANQNNRSDTTAWVHSEKNLLRLIETIQKEWTNYSIKCAMIRNVLHSLEATLSDEFSSCLPVKAQVLPLQDAATSKQKDYKKLLNRKRCESLENRIDHFVKKQRLTVTDPCLDEQEVLKNN